MLGNLHPLARVLRRGTALVAPFGLLAPFAALANPSGADVIHGDVNFSSPGTGRLVIDQTSHNAIINWQQFSIGEGEYVRFNQPSASSAVLNRVIGGNPSEILGNLSANGRVFLINPQGVMFGVGSRVDVGSLAVSTHDIADQDFIDGRYVFAGSSNAGIRNEGEIKAADGGFVVLAADQVHNSGLIQARLGEVVLAAGSGMRFELDTGGLVNFQIDAEAASSAAGVENLGDIVAAGGNVLLSAKVARNLASSAVNNSGRVVATGVEERDGAIYLVAQGGNIDNSGLLDVSGGQRGTVGLYSDGDITLAQGSQIRANGGDGGYVRAVAEQNLLHAEGSTIDVSANAGSATGGFLELSGYEHLAVRGNITLGDKGRLVLDPSLLIVGDNINDTMSFSYLENLLQTNVGAMVELVASEQIIIRERAGAQTLNGRNADGDGAGLFLGIGTMESGCTYSCASNSFAPMTSAGNATFVQGAGRIKIGSEGGDDTLDIAGNIVLWASSDYYYSESVPTSEIAVYANLKSGGGVSLRALGDILTQDIQATGPLFTQLPGFASLDGVGATVGNTGQYINGGIDIRSIDGAIRTGALTAPAVSLDAGDTILVEGDITASATGPARVYLIGGGDVTVDGNVTVEGGPGDFRSESASASANLVSYAGNVTVGDLTVTGTGQVNAQLSAYGYGSDTTGNVTIHGQTTIRADTALYSYEGSEGDWQETTSEQYGSAELWIDAARSIETNGVSVSGPNAFVGLSAGRLELNAGAEGGPALQLTAYTDPEQRSLLDISITESLEGQTVERTLRSDFGIASATLNAHDVEGGVTIDGAVQLTGPTVELLISTPGNVDIDGDLSLHASGYRIEGSDWSLLDWAWDHNPERALLWNAPFLSAGSILWGGASLIIDGRNSQYSDTAYSLSDYSEPAPAGTVRIGGNLSVSGIGTADVFIEAETLTVQGADGITVSADLGTVAGVQTGYGEEFAIIGGAIDEQGEVVGEARHSDASFVFLGNATEASALRSTGGLKVEGGTTRAFVAYAPTVELGSLQLLGGQGEHTSTVAQRFGYDSEFYTLYQVGGLNSALIDVGQLGTLDIAGPVTVSGTGVAALELFGGTVNLGAVSVETTQGEFGITAPDESHHMELDDVILQLFADSGTATADSLTVRTTRLHMGVDLDVDGNVVIEATGGLDNHVSAELAAIQYLSSGFEGQEPESDTYLGSSRIVADNIDLSFGEGAWLDVLTLTASDTLTLDGNGSSLELGMLGESLSGSSLELVNLTLYGSLLELDVENDLTLRNSQLNYGTGLLKAGGELLLQDSGLFGGSHTLQADTIRMDNSTLSAGEGGADTVTLTASLIEVLGDSVIDADTLDFSGDALRIDDATLTGDLDARFIDSISISNATLSGDAASLHQTGREGGGEVDGETGIFVHNSTLDYGTLELDAAGTLSLGGTLRADQLSLRSDGAILQGSQASLLIEAGALDAIGEVIDLSNSTITIGSGTAVNGADASLFDQIPTELRPSSSAPNASFIASGAQGVSIGTITLEGGYLYVQAARASTEQINAPGRLLYNYRPYDNDGPIELPQVSNLSIESDGTTLVYGGTGYAGDVTILNPSNAAAKSSPNQDYVFLTGGTIYGSQAINTSGQVLVLGGTLVDPQSGEHPLEEVADALVVTSHLAPAPKPSEEQEIFHTDLIDEQSTSAMVVEEFQCR